MMTSIALACVNIEGNKHLDLVEKFLAEQNPEVLCLQEILEQDLPRLVPEETWDVQFASMGDVSQLESLHFPKNGNWGVAIATRKNVITVTNSDIFYYVGKAEDMPIISKGQPNSNRRAVLRVDVEKAGQKFTFATTHFTWTNNGETTEEQLRDWQGMKAYLDTFPEFLICGDFNAPRGGQMGNILEETFTSHVPANITTTIDGTLHKAGALQFVVDYILTKGNYSVENVIVHTGVSDHCALTATVKR